MSTKPYLVSENYFPKEEHFDEVLDMLKKNFRDD
jgi:hypothetical protein